MTLASHEIDPTGLVKFARILREKGQTDRALNVERQIDRMAYQNTVNTVCVPPRTAPPRQ